MMEDRDLRIELLRSRIAYYEKALKDEEELAQAWKIVGRKELELMKAELIKEEEEQK